MRAERGGDDIPQGDDGYLGGAAADIDDHAACCFAHGKAGADRRGHRLIDQADVFRACAAGRVMHGALFHLGYAGGIQIITRARLKGEPLVARRINSLSISEVMCKIRNYAVLQGADCDNGAGGTADHLLLLQYLPPQRGSD